MRDLPLIAFAGNPNSGKTTLFNSLTGAHQHVSNYPGATVEVTRATYRAPDGEELALVDLPGTYSLTAYSPEERVARKAIIEDGPIAIVCVLDASNLERNLYFLTQVLELGVPTVAALNMVDEAERRGLSLDTARLEKLLGVPVVPTVARRGEGVAEVIRRARESARDGARPKPLRFGAHVESAVGEVLRSLPGTDGVPEARRRFAAIKLLEGDRDMATDLAACVPASTFGRIAEVRAHLEAHLGDEAEILVADERYGIASGIAREVTREGHRGRVRTTEQIDAVVTNRVLGLPILVLVMWGLFECVFHVGAPAMRGLESVFGWVQGAVGSTLPEGAVRSLLVDGALGGVGGVLVFLPQVLLLFLGIALLEDTGYLARAAFVIDRVMHTFGLHGKSFIPMLLGLGCSVPAVMSARTLSDPKDRIATILVIPLMSCSARLPVYALLAGAFFAPDRAALVVLSLYVLGILLAVSAAKVFRSTLFRGESAPFVMELPPYRAPTALALLAHTWERAWMYVQKAGTTILAMSLIVWAVSSYPQPPAGSSVPPIEYSLAGRAGRALEPVLRPCGFDWRLDVALVSGLAAKEVVVASLATIHGVGSDEEDSGTLRDALRADRAMSPLIAYAFMVFVLVYIPCVSTVAVVWRETGHWRWPLLLVCYTTLLAWCCAMAVYQIGTLVGL